MARARSVIGLLLVLLVAGQSVIAVAVPCFEPAPATVEDAHAGHAGHHMDAAETSRDTAQGCCQPGSYCSMGGCMALSALLAVHAELTVTVPGLPRITLSQPTPEHSPESLYRPPIVG